MPLSKKKEKAYVRSGGSKCPECNSDQIEGGHMEIDGPTAWQSITCLDCNATWDDIYQLIGISDFETGKE